MQTDVVQRFILQLFVRFRHVLERQRMRELNLISVGKRQFILWSGALLERQRMRIFARRVRVGCVSELAEGGMIGEKSEQNNTKARKRLCVVLRIPFLSTHLIIFRRSA